MHILYSWIAHEDFRALEDPREEELGPTLRACRDLGVEQVVLLRNAGMGGADGMDRYSAWVARVAGAQVVVEDVDVDDPSDHLAILDAATAVVSSHQSKHPDAGHQFLLSAGTPAMHSIWLLLAKSRFHAELVKCSVQKGTEVVVLPFELSTDFAEELLHRSDERLVRLTQALPPESPGFERIHGKCRAMTEALAIARRLAPRDVSVLVLGESGTGKELVARAIHASSPRHGEPFVALNCGAIPPELVDSRLFGHVKGSFTGAVADAEGVFEAAQGGTLFLDEIGELPLDAQVRLLRTLQENEVVRIGENHPRPIDVRVVAATHVDLFGAVAAGDFRQDLAYRLAVGIVRLPPLRERGNDLHLLVDRLLDEVNEELADQPDFTPRPLTKAARSLLGRHDWPGNVRELRSTLVRAALFSTGSRIDRHDIEEALLPSTRPTGSDLLDLPLDEDLDLRALETRLRTHYIERALRETGGVKARAARLLNVTPQTFQNWVS